MKFCEDSIKYERSMLSGLSGWCVAAPLWVVSFPRRFGLFLLSGDVAKVRNSNFLLRNNAVDWPLWVRMTNVFLILHIRSAWFCDEGKYFKNASNIRGRLLEKLVINVVLSQTVSLVTLTSAVFQNNQTIWVVWKLKVIEVWCFSSQQPQDVIVPAVTNRQCKNVRISEKHFVQHSCAVVLANNAKYWYYSILHRAEKILPASAKHWGWNYNIITDDRLERSKCNIFPATIITQTLSIKHGGMGLEDANNVVLSDSFCGILPSCDGLSL